MVVKAQARSAELGFVWGLYGLAVRVLEQTDTRVLFFFFFKEEFEIMVGYILQL